MPKTLQIGEFKGPKILQIGEFYDTKMYWPDWSILGPMNLMSPNI